MTSKHLGKLILIGIVFIAVFGYVVFRVWGGTLIDLTLTSNTSLEQGFVGHWSMDGKDIDTSSSTAEVRDRSGQGNNGNFIAPITFRAASSSATATGGATSLTINKPTGVVDNDVMVAALEVSYDTAITAPAGWTLVRNDYQNDGAGVNEFRLAIYYKTASSEGASYTWTFGVSQRASGGIVAYLGVNTLTPVDVEAVQANASSVSVTAPSITTTVGDTRLVFIGTVGYWDSTYTPPTGMTERVDVSVGTDWGSITVADETRAAIGATGTRIGTASATKTNRGALLALKPAITAAPGKIGQALSFDGVDDYVSVPDNNSLDTGDVFTQAFWFKRSSVSNATEGFTGKNIGSAVPALATDNTITLYKDSSGAIAATTITITDTGWHHFVATKNGSAVKLYVDGVDRTGTVTNLTITNTTSQLFIGSDGEFFFKGALDDVRVYNRALSATEVSRLYNLGATTHISKTLNTNPNLASGLVGHWTFDGPKMVSNVGDSSGQGNNGLLSGQTSTTTAAGRVGQGLSFDGVDDYVKVPSSSAFDFAASGGFSYFTWFKKDTACSSPEGTTEVFANRFGSDHGVKTWWFGCDTGGGVPGKLAIDLIPGGAEVGGYVHSQSAINDGAWHYGGWVYDGSANQARLYLDGVLQGASTTAFTVNFDVANPICIGSYGTNCNGKLDDGGAYEADAVFDDARVYNRALSATEVSRLYNLGATTHIGVTLNTNPDLASGLVGHWTFDGPDMDISSSTAEVRDRSGSGNNGNWKDHATTTTTGRLGQALSFDGVDDYVDVGNASSLQLTGAMTVSAWVYTNASSNNGRIVSKADWVGTPNKGWELVMENNSNVSFYVKDSGGTNFGVNKTSQPTEEWRHYAAVYKPSTSMEMYVNGVSASINMTSIPSAIANANFSAYIGARPDDSCCKLTGAIDDARVYNRALSAAEISRLYQLGR